MKSSLLAQAISTGEALAIRLPRKTQIRHKLSQYYRMKGEVLESTDDLTAAADQFLDAVRIHRALVDRPSALLNTDAI